MIKIYPVIKTETECDDYEVYVNGKRVRLDTARVSAYPFNRRWPGHQRQTEQTELINFLSFGFDEPIELTIKPKDAFYTASIRPHDFDGSAEIFPCEKITVKLNKPQYITVEPFGRQKALHIFADGIKDYGVNKTAEDVIYYGAGEHDVGTINLKSGQTLFIDEGAVVYTTVNIFHAENVKILGKGILDNSKNKERIIYDCNAENNVAGVGNAERDMTINVVCGKNIEIDGITIRDSLCYNIDVCSSENVKINGIKIIGCWRYNSDGVHFANCINCSLTNSFLRTFDDSICVRGFANYEYDTVLKNEREENLNFICRDILIENCVVWNDWGKSLQIGTETFAKEIEDVCFKNCELIHTTAIALAIWLVDNAKIHDATFKDINVECDDNATNPSIQNSDNEKYSYFYSPNHVGALVHFEISKHFEYSLIKTEKELGNINGVKVENLRFISSRKPVFEFFGDNPESLCENIEFNGVFWNGEPISENLFIKQTTKNGFVIDIVFKK